MKLELYTKIFIGMVLGVFVGIVAGEYATYLQPIGDLFLRLIRMVVVPLVFASLLVGTASLGDPKKLGRIGMKTVSFYLVSTALAITLGLTIANLAQPGSRLDEATRDGLLAQYQGDMQASVDAVQEAPSVIDTLLRIVPTNPMESLMSGNMLQIIFFALLLGIALTMLPESKSETKRSVVDFFDGIADAMVQVVHIVMKLAPYAVLALIAAVIGDFGLEILMSLLVYSACVLAGLVIHMIVVYSGAVRLMAGMSPLQFFKGIRPAQLIAFSSSSSNATLPVTMECAEDNLGVSDEVSAFVLPLGATVNMDGTALYQGAAAVFIAQVYGLDLTLMQQVTIVLMATLASIGAAGVPGVGIITLAMVLEQIGLPLEGIALILGVDRILDMARTTINVTGDSAVAVVVASSEGHLNPPWLQPTAIPTPEATEETAPVA